VQVYCQVAWFWPENAGNPANLSAMPKEQVEIHLRYEGPDVDDGTMSIQDIVPVLQGFASAYGKLANASDPQSTHRVRISAVRPGSADIVLEVFKQLAKDGWKTLSDNVDAITSGSILAGGAYWIVSKIAGVIQVKKHVKKQPFREHIVGQNTVAIENIENVTIQVPLEIYELFKAGTIDSDLDKMTSPLVPGRIDAAELEARAADGTVLRERIEAEERRFFETKQVVVTSTKETWLVAKLDSLAKTTNNGWLHLIDGTRAFYRFVGPDPQRLYMIFGMYHGAVRIQCVAHMDENLKVTTVDISDIEKMQGELFPDTHRDAGESDDE
jgi:hypothetical protein